MADLEVGYMSSLAAQWLLYFVFFAVVHCVLFAEG